MQPACVDEPLRYLYNNGTSGFAIFARPAMRRHQPLQHSVSPALLPACVPNPTTSSEMPHCKHRHDPLSGQTQTYAHEIMGYRKSLNRTHTHGMMRKLCVRATHTSKGFRNLLFAGQACKCELSPFPPILRLLIGSCSQRGLSCSPGTSFDGSNQWRKAIMKKAIESR